MNYSVAMPSGIHQSAASHLNQDSNQEDLCFALWRPSQGRDRSTALISNLIRPNQGERRLHGNASFTAHYFERALGEALRAKAGLAFMHSHPSNGWQEMSRDDVMAEQGHAAATLAATGLPLVGLTIGRDQIWSARFWLKIAPRVYERQWCQSVRVVGNSLAFSLHPDLARQPLFRPELERTVSAWGADAQTCLARMTVGVIGAGSVGSLVAETLARMGIGRVRLIDFDGVELVNLDRLLFATRIDAFLGRAKVDVLGRAIRKSATANGFVVEMLQDSIVEESGFRAALDCDVLFSCVDRPLPRSILNFIAYAHLIPVVDGGIRVRAGKITRRLTHADWRAHTATPTRPCLECLRQYDPGLVSADREGHLDDPVYIKGLPDDHPIKHNENVFGFSLSAASFEIMQFLSLVISPSGLSNPGAQIYHFVNSELQRDPLRECKPTCLYPDMVAHGDRAAIQVTSRHPKVDQARAMRRRLTLKRLLRSIANA